MKTYQNNPKFKVAIIRPDCSVLPREFYNSQELGLATGLSNLNIDVDVFYAGNVKNVTYEQVNSNENGLVRLIQLPFVNLPLIGQGFYPHLTKELSKNQYDLIQVNEYNDITNYVTVKYARKNKIPVIIYQGMYKNLSGRVNQVYTKLHDILALPTLKKYVSATYGKTKRAAKFLESKGFVKPSVLPVGLEPSPFDNPSVDVKFDRDQLGLTKDQTVITYIGNFEPRRNISFLLELVRSLKDHNVSFVFVGAGEQFDEATRYKEIHNLSNLLILNRIPQTEISQIYALSDIFLLASDYEIYGMVLIEAMYNGVVPISNISAGSESLISHGKDGLLLDNLNVEEWKDNVMQLIDNSEVLNSMKVSAKNKISSTLTWEKVAQYYNEEIITPLRVKHD